MDACTYSTALMYALEEIDADMARLLVELGANPKYATEKKWTILHSAARRFKHENLDYALSFKLPVDSRTVSGATPLMLAASVGYKNNIELLVRAGADVNARDNKGHTALHYAVLNPWISSPRARNQDFIPSIKALVSLGANPSLSDHRKKKPADYIKNDPELKALLKR